MRDTSSAASGGANRFVYGVAAVAALGGLLFGYDIGVVSGALLFIREDFALTAFLQGLVVSALLAGAATGALVSGNLSDRFGRRKLLTAAAVVFALASVACGLAPNATSLILARFVLGLAVGGASLVVPLYIAEMAPPPASAVPWSLSTSS